MTSFFTMLSENFLAIILFAIYAGLVYYVVLRVLRRFRQAGTQSRSHLRKKRTPEGGTRREFSRSLPTGFAVSGEDRPS